MFTKSGINHKGEKIVKFNPGNCTLCGEPLVYFEFMFNIPSNLNSEIDKIVRIQQIESLIEKVTNGEKIDLISMLLGCPVCYPPKSKQELYKMVKKPYVILESEDIFNINNTPISHVYLSQPY